MLAKDKFAPKPALLLVQSSFANVNLMKTIFAQAWEATVETNPTG
jgi:hypothetical protein